MVNLILSDQLPFVHLHGSHKVPKKLKNWLLKYSKDGLTPSQIGNKLRDQHSIPLIKSVTKKTVGEILEENKLQAEMPEDLENIVKKAVGLQKHLKANKR